MALMLLDFEEEKETRRQQEVESYCTALRLPVPKKTARRGGYASIERKTQDGQLMVAATDGEEDFVFGMREQAKELTEGVRAKERAEKETAVAKEPAVLLASWLESQGGASWSQDSQKGFSEDGRRKQLEVIFERVFHTVRVWRVLGGSSRGGLVVRTAASLGSPDLGSRLETGSLVRLLGRKGDRLQYQLLAGRGPSRGWVSLRIHDTDTMARIDKDDADFEELAETLLRRFAMLPQSCIDVAEFPLAACIALTDELHRRKGLLWKLSIQDIWHRQAALDRRYLDPLLQYSAFPYGDAVLESLLSDTSLTPLRRVFPRFGNCDDGDVLWGKTLDPVSGLLPDAMFAAYFLGECKNLEGAVRFGAQSTSLMNRRSDSEVLDDDGHDGNEAFLRIQGLSNADAALDPKSDHNDFIRQDEAFEQVTQRSSDAGEFVAQPQSGVAACILIDAAYHLARLVWKADATLEKFRCRFQELCPCFKTLKLSSNLALDKCYEFASDTVTVDVSLRLGNISLASARAKFGSYATHNVQIPADLPRPKLPVPCPNWVPEELAQARPPVAVDSQSAMPSWDATAYQEAVLDSSQLAVFPVSLAPVEVVKAEDLELQGLRRHQSASRPVAGGENFRSSLSFVNGLAPAAVSHVKYYSAKEPMFNEHTHEDHDKSLKGSFFDGTVKFGSQASEAWFLNEQGLAEGNISLVAHLGVPLAALEDIMADLLRCRLGCEFLTWQLDLEPQKHVPIGQELQLQAFCPVSQEREDQFFCCSKITCDGQTLVTARAILLTG
eukprot:TRINITY_DN30435_c0_g1_i1.p1 TRINITY_DN30435_c0_g1~~TRINITY_DN30435_c0_g1_i1.p1  ORF type:complete len:781 (+),score=130.49 TRINITY_DN30435_c0_g1_i1:43-2385(+)